MRLLELDRTIMEVRYFFSQSIEIENEDVSTSHHIRAYQAENQVENDRTCTRPIKKCLEGFLGTSVYPHDTPIDHGGVQQISSNFYRIISSDIRYSMIFLGPVWGLFVCQCQVYQNNPKHRHFEAVSYWAAVVFQNL